MINALKKFFSKLFPKKLATETTAELPTPTPVFEEAVSTEHQITISYNNEKIEPLFSETWKESTSTLEIPVVEEVKPLRARNRGKFAPDNKSTEEYNEAWVGGKSPAKKSVKKKKKR